MNAPSLSPGKFRSSDLKRKLEIIVWLTLFWMAIGFYQYFDRYSILDAEGCIDESYRMWPFIRGVIFSTLLGGAIASAGLVFLWEKWLRNKEFIRALAYIILWYMGLYAFLTILSVFIFFGSPEANFGTEGGRWGAAMRVLFDVRLLPNFLFWLFVLLSSIVMLFVRDKFGPGVFGSFLLGKYFRPRKEDRVFMFMDLKSSTTIAEKIGEEKYFSFLSDTFRTITPAILRTKGEIYQYVGDEIVISWKKEKGIRNAGFLQCFNLSKELLEKENEYFQNRYGFKPEFKAGIHGGTVVVGEVGIIKRDIAYSGDVLNTTARIQAKCNELETDILISKSIADKLAKWVPFQSFRLLGHLDLKGKSQMVEVVTL